jgi:glutaminase
MCLGYYMKGCGSFPSSVRTSTDLIDTIELFLMTSALQISSHQLAVVAATLAGGGVNPLTGKRVFADRVVRNALSLMTTCGMYDWSGEFAFQIGFPCKSGASGGLMIVIPGKMGIASYSPCLDKFGISARGLRVCEELSKRFNFHRFDDSRFSGKADPTVLGGSLARVHTDELVSAAAENNRIEIMRLIVSHGCDVNSADYDQRTALHVAASMGHLESVKLLLQLGANPQCIDRWGQNPLACVPDPQDEQWRLLLGASGSSGM